MSMTPEQIERNRAFIRDLRANEKKAKGTMRDDEGGRCCLCVALDTAKTLGASFQKDEYNDGDFNLTPPHHMGEFYGWGHRNPLIRFKGEAHSAICYNDGERGTELTHAQIADAFEETFPEIKQP